VREKGEPVHPWHSEIGEDQVRLVPVEQSERVQPAGCGEAIVPAPVQNPRAGVHHVGIVVDDQDRSAAGHPQLDPTHKISGARGNVADAEPLRSLRELAAMRAGAREERVAVAATGDRGDQTREGSTGLRRFEWRLPP
jgi:hypothetical protein